MCLFPVYIVFVRVVCYLLCDAVWLFAGFRMVFAFVRFFMCMHVLIVMPCLVVYGVCLFWCWVVACL